MSPLVQSADGKVARLGLLHRLAESKHRGHQVQQRPAEVMVGDQDIPVTQPQMVDGRWGCRELAGRAPAQPGRVR